MKKIAIVQDLMLGLLFIGLVQLWSWQLQIVSGQEECNGCVYSPLKCHNGTCVPFNNQRNFTCQCFPGYTDDLNFTPRGCVRTTNINCNCAKDVDECEHGNFDCGKGINRGTCNNTPGSYECICKATGQVYNHKQKECMQVDECNRRDNGPCNQRGHICRNTAASFVCQPCPAGHQLHENACYNCGTGYSITFSPDDNVVTCSDIDECATDNGGCHQNCTNTNGSYLCNCRIPGWDLDLEDRMSCLAIDLLPHVRPEPRSGVDSFVLTIILLATLVLVVFILFLVLYCLMSAPAGGQEAAAADKEN